MSKTPYIDPYYTPTKYASGDRYGPWRRAKEAQENAARTMNNAPEPEPQLPIPTKDEVVSGFIYKLGLGLIATTENFGSRFEFYPSDTGVKIIEKKKAYGAFFLDDWQLPVESLASLELERQVFVSKSNMHYVLKAILYGE